MPASEQGNPEDRYTLIPRTLIFLTQGDSVLMLKGSSQKTLWANRFNGVGGHVERGESVLTSARRELHEETGLIAEDLKLCGTVTIDTGKEVGIGIFVFLGSTPKGKLMTSQEGYLIWVSRDEIHDLPLVEDLYELLPKVLAMESEDPPFSAHISYDHGGHAQLVFTD
jgi:8-oxo-dGTP diphosphatase